MRHYSWLINPETGDYELEKGSPIKDESLQFPAYVRLKTPRKSWLYAPDSDYGSDINLVKKQSKTSQRLLERLSLRALQPIIDDGRAQNITVEQTGITRFKTELTVDIIDRNGQSQTITLNPVGL